MGQYDRIEVSDACPRCGRQGPIYVQHQWGSVEGKTQRVGDRIRWDEPKNGPGLFRLVYAQGGVPGYRSAVVTGIYTGCQASCKGPLLSALIEVREDVIKQVHLHLSVADARRLALEMHADSRFSLWLTDTYKPPSFSLAYFLSLTPDFYSDVEKWALDPQDPLHKLAMGGLAEIIKQRHDFERRKAELNGVLDPSQMGLGAILSRLGLERVRMTLQQAASTKNATSQLAEFMLGELQGILD